MAEEEVEPGKLRPILAAAADKPVKEANEDDESSQSINLVLEDPEENCEEPKSDAGKDEKKIDAEKVEKVDDAKAETNEAAVPDRIEEQTVEKETEKVEDVTAEPKDEGTKKTEDTGSKVEAEKVEVDGAVAKTKGAKVDADTKKENDDAAVKEGGTDVVENEAETEPIKDRAEEAEKPKDEVKGEPEKKETDGTKQQLEKELPAEKVTAAVEIKSVDNEIKKDTAPAANVEEAQPESKSIAADKAKPETPESELGIVGPPTAASELLSEAELVAEKPALPTDETKPGNAQVSERVVRWVENTSAKADDPAPPEGDVERMEGDDDDEEEEDEEEEEEDNDEEEDGEEGRTGRIRGRKRRRSSGTNGGPATRKSQKVVGNIIRRSIRCLNKMHAMDSNAGGNGKKAADELKREEEEDSRKSPKVPQSQQNGAALPEETASADRNLPGLSQPKKEKNPVDSEASLQAQSLVSKSSKPQSEGRPGRPSSHRSAKLLQPEEHQQQQPIGRETRKRRSAESAAAAATNLSANGSAPPKKLCLDPREQFINSLVGSDKSTAEQLATRAEQLRAEVQDLDELARAKEMEWNEILSMRKLKEEAYLRIERRRQVMGFMESNGPLATELPMPSASLAMTQHDSSATSKHLVVPKEERDDSSAPKRDRASKAQQSSYQQQQQQLASKLGENGPKQRMIDAQSPEHRQIGEGRQGPIVDVRSIIADYRLRHPDTVPRRRGRRMRNSVNVGLGAGGAMVETVGNLDSRPSSTDSCKSNSNANDPNNAMSFKDVLVQFAKLSQQQGEPIKTPQNYPDVTLHPVAAAPTTQNSTPQASGSLLHGILTKSQSPRPTTFSPTLARLLTAPERERSAPTITPAPHQSAQHLLQAYQAANPVSITDFLSSSKARTEITITPVVNNPVQTHSNSLIHVDDAEEETSIIEERDSRLSMGARDNADDRDSPPRCQGCHERAAQFVCAGCGNQWYCSRECQVAAWDDHSEACSV